MNKSKKPSFAGRLMIDIIIFLIPAVILGMLGGQSGFVNAMISGYIFLAICVFIYVLVFKFLIPRRKS